MITSIRLQNFRSYKDDSFEFDEGVNIIVGPNASGKTNLLESLLVLAGQTSFRNKDVDLVRFGSPWARLDGLDQNSERVLKLVQQSAGNVAKELTLDNKLIKRTALHHTLPTVLFEPNHLMLLHGPPELRRDYIDNLLEQTTSGYARLRRDYRRTLSQRNALLKHGGAATAGSIFAWNIRLSEMGGQIALKRHQMVEEFNKDINFLYRGLSSGPKTSRIIYHSRCDIGQYSSSMLHRLEADQQKDIDRGFTSAGPHRDDMIVELDGRPVNTAASRGETRSLLLTLKVMEVKVVEKLRETKPVLLLDDVFSELDGARRRALTDVLSGYQTFITTTDADIVVKHFMNKCNIIPVSRT